MSDLISLFLLPAPPSVGFTLRFRDPNKNIPILIELIVYTTKLAI